MARRLTDRGGASATFLRPVRLAYMDHRKGDRKREVDNGKGEVRLAAPPLAQEHPS